MILPTPDETAALWLLRAWGQKYCYVQDVFAGDSSIERAHRDNCRLLIKRNYLRPEVDDGVKPYRRYWDMTIRYYLVPASLRLPVEASQTPFASLCCSEDVNAAHIG
jgi:hypothetical protein